MMLRLYALAIALVTGVLGALGLRWAGGRAERVKRERDDAKGYRDARERTDDAVDGLSDDPGVLRDWLRDRGQRKP